MLPRLKWNPIHVWLNPKCCHTPLVAGSPVLYTVQPDRQTHTHMSDTPLLFWLTSARDGFPLFALENRVHSFTAAEKPPVVDNGHKE